MWVSSHGFVKQPLREQGILAKGKERVLARDMHCIFGFQSSPLAAHATGGLQAAGKTKI